VYGYSSFYPPLSNLSTDIDKQKESVRLFRFIH